MAQAPSAAVGRSGLQKHLGSGCHPDASRMSGLQFHTRPAPISRPTHNPFV
jgi:hypothetical protein